MFNSSSVEGHLVYFPFLTIQIRAAMKKKKEERKKWDWVTSLKAFYLQWLGKGRFSRFVGFLVHFNFNPLFNPYTKNIIILPKLRYCCILFLYIFKNLGFYAESTSQFGLATYLGLDSHTNLNCMEWHCPALCILGIGLTAQMHTWLHSFYSRTWLKLIKILYSSLQL